MIKNYIIIAFRNIRRNFTYAFLNVFGLALGIASCLVIFLIVRNELNFDNFAKSDRIYRVTWNAIDFNSNTSMAIGYKMRNDFPELEKVTQVMYRTDALVKINNTRFREKQYAVADEYFTSVFNYDWIAGDPKTALAEPNSTVLTESAAKKYFGNANAMGQVVNLDNHTDLKVTGIIKDAPANTSVPFNFLISMATVRKQMDFAFNNVWAIGGGFFTYILLPPNYPVSKIQNRVSWFFKKELGQRSGARCAFALTAHQGYPLRSAVY